MADKIVVLDGGKIEQVGSPMTLYNKPATPFVAGFIGSPKMNLFDGELAAKEGCRTYGIRPEHILLSETEGRWRGSVRHIERLGADTIIFLEVPQLPAIVVRTDGDRPISPGQTLFATPLQGKEQRFG